MSAEFVHLHNHSDYSLLDGAQTVQTLVNTIDDMNMDSVALTEHGNMFSVVPYYKSAKKAGVKPIIGCEIYVAHDSRFDKKPRAEGGWGNNHRGRCWVFEFDAAQGDPSCNEEWPLRS